MSIERAKLHACQAKLSQKAFGPLFISTCLSLSPLNNKGGVFSNPMRKGFTDPQRRLKVNEFGEEAMFIEAGQFPDPGGEFHILLLQV